MPRLVTATAAAGALMLLAACEPLSPRLVPVHLYLTDAPGDQIESAVVRISRAILVPADDGEHLTIVDEPREYDLLDLQNGVRALLGTSDVPEGEYAQLRLVVERAEITLKEEFTFADGTRSRTLFVPSGMETGIKVQFPGTLTIDGETEIEVDFDVARNFVFLGPPDRPVDVLFTPLLVGRLGGEQ